ncbi:MAG: DUF6288 domain-containing protein [Luteolibacter sp.]
MKITQKSIRQILKRLTCLTAFLLLGSGNAFAIKDENNQSRWGKPCTTGPDAEVPGFLVNMGPTGARGTLTKDSYIVKYIFKNSPSAGVLQIDDEVYGANGKTFPEHTFGGASIKFGIEGPLQALGLAIEDSEGEDGVLELMVKRGGEKLKVNVQLEKLGRFSDTFPVNCAKTDLLKKRAYDYLIAHPGGLDSQGRCVAILSMLGSDDPKVAREGKKLALEWNKPYNKTTWAWHLGFQGIVLSEYHLLTGDRKVLKTLESTMDLLEGAQWKPPINHYVAEKMKNPVSQAELDKHQALYEGGFGHAPYEFIVERGGGGYGPMQWPTCLALMTWELAGQCGVDFDPESPERSYRFLEYGTNSKGKVAYGGEFTLNNGPVDPKAWKARGQHGFSHKSGLAYLVHMLAKDRDDSEDNRKLHLENIGESYRDMTDGHACALMGLTWGMAGVYASDDEKLKKKITDYYKAWLNMARCHGSDSYVILPGRDYADSSYYRKNIRNHTTAAVAFIYSYSNPTLRIHGAEGNAIEIVEEKPTPAPTNFRKFFNADKTRSFEGELVAFDPRLGLVRIRQRNGQTVDLELDALSEADKKYLRKSVTEE